VSWSCWESFHRRHANIDLERYWHAKCRSYDDMNARTKAFWKSVSPSMLASQRAKRNPRRVAKGDIEGTSVLVELKIEPQEEEQVSHRLQVCYRRGPSSQVARQSGGDNNTPMSPSYCNQVGAHSAPSSRFHASEGIAYQFSFSRLYKDFVDPDVDSDVE
jgi:hypothetical protein